MDTCTWNCCRLCLSRHNLYPIFAITEHSEKYTNTLFTVTGLKVEPKDMLPQSMCLNCINFINESVKFRRKCEDAEKQLQIGLSNKEIYEIKTETQEFKIQPAIDISYCIEKTDDDFKDYDDNITLDLLQFNNYSASKENNYANRELESDTKLQNLMDQPINVNIKKKSTNIVKPRAKRKERTKKENGEQDIKNKKKSKGERVREDIECEYCHKILTSKLSLRNHYKIHTGFDVVCEHCGKKFITRRLLLMHCRAKHGYEKTDKCSYCDYKASNAEQVKIHERLHTGERPYVCAQCTAGFHRKSSYLQHIAIHLPEKTVQCDQCPARFKSVTLMRIHKNRHRAPQYSFRCAVCDNSFARRRNVARHLQRVHGLPPDQQHIDRLKIG